MLQKLQQKLARQKVQQDILPGFTASAVLIPLYAAKEGVQVLYTLRSARVQHHKHQIAFPGGIYEKVDHSLEHTALRETKEELGLERRDIEIWGPLPVTYTPTRFFIQPYVAWIKDPAGLNPNEEIAELIPVPLEVLQKMQAWEMHGNEFFGSDFALPAFAWQGQRIWGATGRMSYSLIQLLRGKV